MYYVYALQSLKKNTWLYIGVTKDLKQRLARHKDGKVYSTSRFLPVRLVFYEAYLAKQDATKREYELKNNSQQKDFLKEKIQHSLASAKV